MKKILIINGPSLNFLGIREKEVYGDMSYKQMTKLIKEFAKENNVKVKIVQTNHEGKIIDYLQLAHFKFDGCIINPGAYAHYSYAIMDAIKSIQIPCIEVHLSDITKREEFRKVSITGSACKEIIAGKGINGYLEAINYFC